jgi:hypothetical protein
MFGVVYVPKLLNGLQLFETQALLHCGRPKEKENAIE